MTTELKAGDRAPDFAAFALGGAYGSGETVRLADFTGKYLVLYFYPKDDTPGCTVQACGVRDRWPDFQSRDAVIFGVSTDSLASHQAFIAKHGLPFPLLSDESGHMVRNYGVWVENNFAGKTSMGTERSTFVIAPDGRIEAIFRRVKPEEHVDQVLAVIQGASKLDTARARPLTSQPYFPLDSARMDAKNTFLQLFEKLEGFVGKLPGGLQKPILHEITPLKDLFLRQRAPRFVLAGDPTVGSAGLFNAIFSAPVAPFAHGPQADLVPPAGGWQDFSHGGHGVLRLLDCRAVAAPQPLADAHRLALMAEQPDMFLFLTAFPGSPEGAARLAADMDRLETLLDLSAQAHTQSPSVFGLVVSNGESENAAAMESARVWLHAALISRPKIAPRLAPTLDVDTFMRFRLDGTFDPESDRRRNVAELVHRLVAELPNEARLEMARLSGAREAQARIAQTLVKSVSAVCGALGAQPIPLADLPFLLTFQVAMVAGIIYISGQNMSAKLATEFLGTMGINIGVGLALREGARAAARAAAKLLLPGIGNAVSGLVAAGGTYAIGRAATAFYIEGVSLGDARKLLKRESRWDRGIAGFLGGRKSVGKPAPGGLPPDTRRAVASDNDGAQSNGNGSGNHPAR